MLLHDLLCKQGVRKQQNGENIHSVVSQYSAEFFTIVFFMQQFEKTKKT
jgi:hypothetical protein